MSRFSGRAAEKAFSTLCSRRGITCNEPREDDNGWDHVVEFPHTALPRLSADRQQRLPAIFVQTKSHDGDGLEVRMKLSNALKLTQSPNPCFVLLATSIAEATETRWHAVHFWDALMTRVLERARSASHDGISESEFHRLSFSFRMTEADERAHNELLPWMEQAVRRVGLNYAGAKRHLCDTLGFGKERFAGTLEFGPLGSVEELIDHQLGLTDSLPLQKIELHERRFGIDMPLTLPDFAHALVYLKANSVGQCKVRLVGPDGYEIVLHGELTLASVPGLPTEQRKVRIQTPVLDIVWATSGASTVILHLDTAQRRFLAELEHVCRVISWGGQGPIDMKVAIANQRLLGAELRLDPQPDRVGYKRLAVLSKPLIAVSRHLTTMMPSISVEELDGADGLEEFHDLIMGSDMRMSAMVASKETVPNVDQAVGYGLVNVGEWVFGAVTRWQVLSQERLGDRWSLQYGPPSFLERYAFHYSDTVTLAHVGEDYNRHATKPSVLAIGDILPRLKT